MLAYVLWHRPRVDVGREAYEESLRRFHASLGVRSASFRLRELPFSKLDGYEDWYLVDDWAALGELNAAAIDQRRRGSHDLVAGLSADGWGGVYLLVGGTPEIPAGTLWLSKPPDTSYAVFLGGLGSPASVWQRQMVLAPAPEFCVAGGPTVDRVSI
jgi:hypothetical protein